MWNTKGLGLDFYYELKGGYVASTKSWNVRSVKVNVVSVERGKVSVIVIGIINFRCT